MEHVLTSFDRYLLSAPLSGLFSRALWGAQVEDSDATPDPSEDSQASGGQQQLPEPTQLAGAAAEHADQQDSLEIDQQPALAEPTLVEPVGQGAEDDNIVHGQQGLSISRGAADEDAGLASSATSTLDSVWDPQLTVEHEVEQPLPQSQQDVSSPQGGMAPGPKVPAKAPPSPDHAPKEPQEGTQPAALASPAAAEDADKTPSDLEDDKDSPPPSREPQQELDSPADSKLPGDPACIGETCVPYGARSVMATGFHIHSHALPSFLKPCQPSLSCLGMHFGTYMA